MAVLLQSINRWHQCCILSFKRVNWTASLLPYQADFLTDNGPNQYEASCPFTGHRSTASSYRDVTIAGQSFATPNIEDAYQCANNTIDQIVQSLPKTALAPTDPYARDTYPEGWRWECEKTEDGTVLRKWCTVNPTGKVSNVITVLLHLDPKAGISIMLALPERCEQGKKPTGYWDDDLIRSYVTNAVEKTMNKLNLPACLHESILKTDRAQTKEENDEDEEFLMKAANTLMERFNLNELELTVTGGTILCDVVFRRAEAWGDISTGERHTNQKTLVRDLTSRRHTLPTKKGDRIFAQVSSLGDSRVDEAEE
jgi:hypothetical protein